MEARRSRGVRGSARAGRRRAALAPLLLFALLRPGSAAAPAEPPPGSLDLAKVKEEEAREKLERLEETMDKLSRLLAESEPQNAAKLRRAFQESRERLIREGMDRVIGYLREKKIDRAIEEHKAIRVNLEELLAILQEEDVDPREILKHIERLRDIVKNLDESISEQAAEKSAADEAAAASAAEGRAARDLERLEDLIRREAEIEKDAADSEGRGGEGLGALAPRQDAVREETRKLAAGEGAEGAKPGGGESGAEGGKAAAGAEGAKPGRGESGAEGGKAAAGREGAEPSSGAKAAAGESAEAAEARSPLDRSSLERAAGHMARAAEAMRSGDASGARGEASRAREALEDAAARGRDALERLRALKDLSRIKAEQDSTKAKAEAIAKRMEEPPPLVSSPEGGVPGRPDVEKAAGEMGSASENLAGGRPGRASRSQKDALDDLRSAREKVEEALEALQRAFRDRLLAYLRDKFQRMLLESRAVSRETKSLDLKIRALRVASASASTPVDPELDRGDRQLAQSLSEREGRISLLADDVLDVLAEDGTTLVFPGVVEEVQRDILDVAALLARIETGERTQYIQGQIESAIEDILRALEEAQRSPPPPDPSRGRNSRSGAGPLLPLSAELRMVRALQARVYERTRAFDEVRPADPLDPESKLRLDAISKKQKEVERMLRKLAEAAGER